MSAEKTPAEQREERLSKLSQRTDAPPTEPLPEKVSELYQQLQRYLFDAFDEGALADSQSRIFQLLKQKPSSTGGLYEIYGGLEGTDFRRESEERFTRDDGARINFKMTVAERKKEPLEILSYSFEICFPNRLSPRFIRYDLNFINHQNDQEGKRSHVHPGHDDLSFPCQRMSPFELLDLLFYDLRFQRRERDQNWIVATLTALREDRTKAELTSTSLPLQTQTLQSLQQLSTQLTEKNSWKGGHLELATNLLAFALILLQEEVG